MGLTEKARRIGEGDFDQSVHIISKDEIGVLAAEFNRMRVRLRDLRKSDYWRLLVEQKKADAVIDSIYEPVIVTDAQGRVTKINKAARSLFGHESNAAGGGDISLSGVIGGERILSAVRDAVRMQRPVAAEGEAALVPIKVGNAAHRFRLRATPREESGRIKPEDQATLAENIRLATELGAQVVKLKGRRVADALIEFARREGITHAAFGQSARSRWDILLHGSIINRFLDDVRDATVQVVPLEEKPPRD